jgi:hypothetical protein
VTGDPLQLRARSDPALHNSYSLLQIVDKLVKQTSSVPFQYNIIHVKGDLKDEDGQTLSEDLKFWKQNLLDTLRELASNPAFEGSFATEPEMAFADEAGANLIFDKL